MSRARRVDSRLALVTMNVLRNRGKVYPMTGGEHDNRFRFSGKKTVTPCQGYLLE